MTGDRFGRIAALVTRRPLLVLALTALLAVGGVLVALRLEPSAGTETLVDRGSDSFEANERFQRDFGDDAVLVLVQGELARTVLTDDLQRLVGLEGCLSGNVPDTKKGLGGLPPVCREIARLDPAKAVYGPGTFVNTAASQIARQFTVREGSNRRRAERAADAARRLSRERGDPPAQQEQLAGAAADAVRAEFFQQLLQLGIRYGLSDIPRINDPGFVSSLVFDGGALNAGTPKSRFAYLFPSRNAALIQIRMRPDLSDAERREAIGLIRQAVAEREFRPRRGARYVVTGLPVVTEALADEVQGSILVLLGAALVLMAATLLLVFRSRMRLLPLALGLAAAAVTFGGLSLAGGSLTMASIAVLPVLIGLAVDYAIQFQARYDEALATGAPPRDAAIAAAAAGGPTILTAGLATAAGFLVLLLSPIPMVRGFGALLVVGIGLALLCAFCAGFAALTRLRRARPAPAAPSPLSGPRERLAGGSWRALGVALVRPRRVLAIGLAVALLGLLLDTQSEVVSDVRELVPADLQALRDVDTLQDETGVSGEVDVTVRAADVTRPEVIAWMSRFQERVLRENGYRPGKRCGQAKDPPELCPALSLTDLFSGAGAGRAEIRRLLATVPPYFSQGVITADRRTANLAFGIRLMSLERQQEVVDGIRRSLDPPDGVDVSIVGLPVLAAEANSALSSPLRRMLTLLAALGAVFAVLLVLRRSAREALVPLIPIALATGWSGLILFVLGLLPGPFEVDLNPMSVTLGALVIAISTEFSVLLSARYAEERRRGAGPARAIELAYASTGAAVLASGITATAGFAALIFSDIRMLRDFGIVTVVDLGVSLAGVMFVLPAALVWAEQHGPLRIRDLLPLRPRRAQADSSP